MDWEYMPKIDSLREKKGLTQIELARKVGVTETTIANWEKGRSGIEWIDRLIRLCNALDCQAEELLAYIPHGSENDNPISESKNDNPISEIISLVTNGYSSEPIDGAPKEYKFSELAEIEEANQPTQTIPAPAKVSAKSKVIKRKQR
jgi:transcriptional regulator with XRE-family HTH domain